MTERVSPEMAPSRRGQFARGEDIGGTWEWSDRSLSRAAFAEEFGRRRLYPTSTRYPAHRFEIAGNEEIWQALSLGAQTATPPAAG